MKRILRKIGLIIVVGLLLLITILIIRTETFLSKQLKVETQPNKIGINKEKIYKNLSKAIKFKTISYPDTSDFDNKEFLDFHAFIDTTYLNVKKSLEKECFGKYSLLYTWKGKSENLKPIILMSHFDVVGIEKGTEKQWEEPPFDGIITDEYIWGRGTLDDKSGVLGILEAVETLLENGFEPQQTIYLAFGHDEEVGGLNGARRIAEHLKSKKVEPQFVLDEGGIVVEGMLPGLEKPSALVGIAEKGYVSIVLTVSGPGGHSSGPPKHTTVGRLSRAIHKLEENPFQPEIKGATKVLFDFIGPEMGYLPKLLFANLWLTEGIMKTQLLKSSFTNAMLRTTGAATVFETAKVENVLPKQAKAIINFRILPGDSIKDVIKHAQETINDTLVKVEAISMGIPGGNEPSPVSDVSSTSFIQLQKSIHQVFPDAVVAPWQLIGTTDSKYYNDMCENIYRFVPIQTTHEDMGGYHGTNERISIASYQKCVEFYMQLILNLKE